MSPKDELHYRLERHRSTLKKITVSWTVGDGGPWMTVTLYDRDNGKLDQWSDWLIMGDEFQSGVEKIMGIVESVCGAGAIFKRDIGTYYCNMTLR